MLWIHERYLVVWAPLGMQAVEWHGLAYDDMRYEGCAIVMWIDSIGRCERDIETPMKLETLCVH